MDVSRVKRQHCGAPATSRKRPFAVVPSQFVAPARVQMQRMMPVWMAKVRWLVLRGSKSPILAAYRHAPTGVVDERPIRVILLDTETTVHVVGEKGMVIVSSRVRRNDTWAITFQSGGERKRMYELLKTWIELSTFLQSLTGFQSIARSQSSVVYRCHDREDKGREYALKQIDRTKCPNEIEVTEKLVDAEALQPYVPRYVFMFEDGKSCSVTIAMKHYAGGTLADRIGKFGFLPDNVVRSVMSSLCVVLFLLHQHGILHLDVKAANILFDAESSRSFQNLKLVDFGSSVLFTDTLRLPLHRNVSGTYGCMAPERFDGRYGPEADVYGAGVVLYNMVTGEIPFSGVDSYQVMAKNMSGVVSFAHPRWRRVSPDVRRLAERMLEREPRKRIRLAEVLKTPWLCQSHSRQDLVAAETAPPAHLAHSDPFAFFA